METKRGIPYSVGELRAAAKGSHDPYHAEIMAWAADQIDCKADLLAALEQMLAAIRVVDAVDCTRLEKNQARHDAEVTARAAIAKSKGASE